MNTNPMTGGQDPGYVMGRTSGEYERLRRQSELLDSITVTVLDRVGLGFGMQCLDVGCGPGEVMRLMAERVGPTGRVLGIDLDGKLGSEALSVLTSKGYRQCSFIEGGVERLEQIARDPFDLVFARLLLMHLDDPILGLRRMYSPTMDSYPTVEPLAEFKKVFLAVFDKMGRETRMGIKLPGFFIEAGIGAPDGTDVTGFLQPIRLAAEMATAIYRSVLPLALKHGVTTEERSEWFFEEIRKARECEYYVLSPLLVSAWRQKPVEK